MGHLARGREPLRKFFLFFQENLRFRALTAAGRDDRSESKCSSPIINIITNITGLICKEIWNLAISFWIVMTILGLIFSSGWSNIQKLEMVIESNQNSEMSKFFFFSRNGVQWVEERKKERKEWRDLWWGSRFVFRWPSGPCQVSFLLLEAVLQHVQGASWFSVHRLQFFPAPHFKSTLNHEQLDVLGRPLELFFWRPRGFRFGLPNGPPNQVARVERRKAASSNFQRYFEVTPAFCDSFPSPHHAPARGRPNSQETCQQRSLPHRAPVTLLAGWRHSWRPSGRPWGRPCILILDLI